jgi:sec-independent protein translocase protein TatA
MEIFGLGLPELIIIVLVLLLLFGASKLPELGRSIGGFTREVKKGFGEDEDDKKKKSDSSKEE